MPGTRQLTGVALALLLASACGASSDSGLYGGSGAKSGSGGMSGATGSGGAAGVPEIGGSAGVFGSGGSAGVDAAAGSGGSAGAEVDASFADAGPDGNNPVACPPLQPQPGSACNVFINNTDCIYGIKHCVCTISSWLCVL